MNCKKTWTSKRLLEVIDFHPKEMLRKGQRAKKIAMEQLRPYSKTPMGYCEEFYNGGAKFKNGDTLLARITPCLENGKTAQVNELDEGEVGFGSTEYIVLRSKEGKSDKDFIYYLSISPNFRSIAIKSMVGSSGRQRVQQNVLENAEFLLPDLKTQKKISAVLGSLDNKIELNEKINQNLESQAQAIFKSWFVDFEPFGGKMPADWKAYKLGEFLPVITGKKNANVSSSKGKYPFFSCAQDTAWTDEFSFDANAILVAGNGDFNVKFYSGKFEAYQRTYVLIPHNPTFTNWLYYVVKYNLERITSGARGSVIKFITKGNLEDFSFFAPRNLDKLTPIDFFNSTNNKIAENKLEILKLAQLRDTLLPKLMSGEIDVSDVAV